MVNHSTTLDDVFGALSDPVRRRIVERLTRGELTAGAIAGSFSINRMSNRFFTMKWRSQREISV